MSVEDSLRDMLAAAIKHEFADLEMMQDSERLATMLVELGWTTDTGITSVGAEALAQLADKKLAGELYEFIQGMTGTVHALKH